MDTIDDVRQRLIAKKEELLARLDRISENRRRPLEADSAERATQTENLEVVDALGNEARQELKKIDEALDRLSSGDFGVCMTCGGDISADRILAHPYARRCIDCAAEEEQINARPSTLR